MWVIGLPEARWITPYPARHPSTLCALRAQAISVLKAKSGREGRGWCQLRQLEEELDQASRSTNQVAEVFQMIVVGGGEFVARELAAREHHPAAETTAAPSRTRSDRGRT